MLGRKCLVAICLCSVAMCSVTLYLVAFSLVAFSNWNRVLNSCRRHGSQPLGRIPVGGILIGRIFCEKFSKRRNIKLTHANRLQNACFRGWISMPEAVGQYWSCWKSEVLLLGRVFKSESDLVLKSLPPMRLRNMRL